jgi:hypothetical protein
MEPSRSKTYWSKRRNSKGNCRNFLQLVQVYQRKYLCVLSFKYYAIALHSDLDCHKELKVMLKIFLDEILEAIYQNYSNDAYISRIIYYLLDNIHQVN